jgi:hypothetical protein
MSTSDQDTPGTSPRPREPEPRDVYEPPQIIDYGTLSELTLSGVGPLTDSLLGAGS